MLCSNLTREQSNALYEEVLRAKEDVSIRRLCQHDLFFLLTIGCKRKDLDHDWLYARCREVEAAPNGMLDLWAREHYKSTIITFGLTIQDILNDPEVTVGIFSHTRPIAKGFLEQIKRELEVNEFLKKKFPDVLWDQPHRESPRWSLDGGIIVKRKSNPKEATVEAWGLVDGQPTSKHFSRLVYDDVVTKESVSTPDQIKKVTDALALSYNLGAKDGVKRFIGTRYHLNDTYRMLMERKTATTRLHPATIDGTFEGKPVLWTPELLAQKRRDMGPYVAACQLMQNPKEDSVMGFEESWLRFYDFLRNYSNWNFYILVDPANEKKKENDYTVMLVIALAPDQNYYLVDGIRDRLNLRERTSKLFEFVRRYNPIRVGYEQYGMMADKQHVEYVMEQENFRFNIVAVAGATPKPDRIRRLVPICEQGRFWLPHQLYFVDRERKPRDLIREFVQDEYLPFPVAVHDDILDCASRIVEPVMLAVFPEKDERAVVSSTYNQEPSKVLTEYDVLA